MRGHRFALLSTYAVCVAFSACSLAAQRTPPSFVLAEVHASGSHRYSDAQIAATAGLKPGDPINRDKLQEISDQLAQLGVFSRVNFRFTAKDNRATVNFELQDAAVVPVMFENFPWFSDQELSDEIRRAVPLFDGGAPNGGSLLEEITQAAFLKLASRGIKADVEHALIAQPSGDEMIMQFRQDGASFNIASISLGDSVAQNSEKLHDRVSDLTGKTFSRSAIELFENEQVRPIYLSAGQIRVKFGAPVVHIGDGSGERLPAAVDVQIPIEPGPVFRLSGATWTGNMAIDNAVLSSSYGGEAGRPRRRHAPRSKLAAD